MIYLLIIASFVVGILFGVSLKKDNSSKLREYITKLEQQNKNIVSTNSELVDVNTELAKELGLRTRLRKIPSL